MRIQSTGSPARAEASRRVSATPDRNASSQPREGSQSGTSNIRREAIRRHFCSSLFLASRPRVVVRADSALSGREEGKENHGELGSFKSGLFEIDLRQDQLEVIDRQTGPFKRSGYIKFHDKNQNKDYIQIVVKNRNGSHDRVNLDISDERQRTLADNFTKNFTKHTERLGKTLQHVGGTLITVGFLASMRDKPALTAGSLGLAAFNVGAAIHEGSLSHDQLMEQRSIMDQAIALFGNRETEMAPLLAENPYSGSSTESSPAALGPLAGSE